MRSLLAAFTLLAAAAAAVAQPTDLTPEKVTAQCKLLEPNSVLLKNKQLSLYLCEAADSQFVLAADQLIEVTLDKDVLLKLRSGELIRPKRQFGAGFGGSSAQSSAYGGGGGFGGGGFGGGGLGGYGGPGGGGGFGGGGSSAQSSAFGGGGGFGGGPGGYYG